MRILTAYPSKGFFIEDRVKCQERSSHFICGLMVKMSSFLSPPLSHPLPEKEGI